MTIEILSTKIQRGGPEEADTRYVEIAISDGADTYLWRVGGLPLEGDLQAILDAREAELWAAASVAGEVITADVQGKRDFRKMPDWTDWTGQEAADHVHVTVLSGMTKAEVEAWIEANVTNLATAKDALKLLGGELVDLRDIMEKAAQAIMYLRDIVVGE